MLSDKDLQEMRRHMEEAIHAAAIAKKKEMVRYLQRFQVSRFDPKSQCEHPNFSEKCAFY
jgi:hypothetical protein